MASPAKPGLLPTDFVLCIDNSGSISAHQQDFVREVTMLLADLADVGDRISVITFGNAALVSASVIIQ
jgi:Mg-chelatase subunit ChlD